MDADRVVEAVRRHVLMPSEEVQRRWDEAGPVVCLVTRCNGYTIRPAGWAIGDEPWVREAVRVLGDGEGPGGEPTFGLLFPRDGEAMFLNDVATMRRLGRRLGDGLDPIAYAELLAELHYSPEHGDPPSTRPFSPGRLVRDPDELRDRYPFVDPELIRAPVVRDDGRQRTVTFQSHIRYLLAANSAIDIFDWTVVAPHGEPATWSRRDVVRRLPVRGRRPGPDGRGRPTKG